ncbi:uncharacterized protein LOC115231200, partial [Octopus sinensis]|uniref:Uncharacterized protein LOC115231200 n=1 Tax=Octopus sinensis TaxID=2607531 RepID=A0A6P7U6N0_9MOLL
LDDLTAQLLELKQQLEASKREQFEAAATKIQRAYRRFCPRCKYVKTVQRDATQVNQALGERDGVGDVGGSPGVGAVSVGLAVGGGDREREEELVVEEEERKGRSKLQQKEIEERAKRE